MEYENTDEGGYGQVNIPEDSKNYGWLNWGVSDNTVIYSGVTYEGCTEEEPEAGTVEICLHSPASVERTFTLVTDEDFPAEELTLNEIKDIEPAEGWNYYTFTAPFDGVYYINSSLWTGWNYKETSPEHKVDSFAIPLKTGEKIKYGGSNSATASELSIQIWGEPVEEVKGARLEIPDYSKDCIFIPSRSGNYSVPADRNFSIWYKEENEADWTKWSYWDEDRADSIYLEAGKKYWFTNSWISQGGALAIYQNMTILDYDYYEAFIASGGAVSVGNDGTVTLSGGKAGTVLDRIKALTENVLAVASLDSYGPEYADEFAAANQYWKDDEGRAFEAAEFYRIEKDGTLTEVTGQESSEADKALAVRYLPKIVWVESMTITTENGETALPVDVQVQLTANPKAATEKYDFRQAPQIRWESSDPDVAEVDQNGLVTTHKTGKVTITAYADEELRAYYREMGMDMPKYTAASIDLNVAKTAFPFADGVSFKNLTNFDGVKKVGEVEKILTEQLLQKANANYTGTFEYTDQDGKLLNEDAEVPAGTNTWKVSYKPGENDIYDGAETTVTVDYGTLDMKVTAADGTTLSATNCGGTKMTAKPHPSETALQVELSYNGKTISAEELSKSGYTLGEAKLSTDAEGILSTDSAKMTVIGLGAGTDSVKVEVPVSVTGTDKTVTLAQTLSFTVKDESVRAVKSITIKKADGTDVPKMIKAEDVAAQKVEIPLALTLKDFAGADYSDAKVAWTTSDKSVASVTVAKDGNSTLVIPKKASGIAELTVTSKDYNKASTSFRIIVADADVRVLNTTITTNSLEVGYTTLEIAPNTMWAEAMGIDEENLAVEVFPSVPEQGEKFGFVGKGYTGWEGTGETGKWYGGVLVDTNRRGIGIGYKDPNEKAGKTTLTLNMVSYDNSKTKEENEAAGTYMIVTKTITIVNKPAYPKASVKVTQNYNTFWNSENENSYATVVLTTEGDVSWKANTDPAPQALSSSNGAITLEENDYFELVDAQSYEEGQWTLTLKAKDGVTPKKTTLTFDVEYEWYREPAKIKATVNVSSQTPSFNLVTEANSTVFYPELGETDRIVLMKVPEGIKAEDIDLTAAAKKNYELTNVEIVDASEVEEKLDGIEGSVARMEIQYTTGKTADLQFTVTSDQFAKANASVTSKKLRLTAKKLSAEKLQVCDDVTGAAKTAYNLQQQMAGKELLTLVPQMPNLAGYNDAAGYDIYSWSMEVEGGNTFTKDMVKKKALDVQPGTDGTYQILTTPELFEQKTGNCILKCTFYATSENGDQEEHQVKVVNIRLNLQKQKQAPKITATVKASNALNVVDFDKNYAMLTPTFKNLPYGAKVTNVVMANDADAELYELTFDKADSDGKATIGTKTTDTPIPLGTDKIDLVYTICLSDGSEQTVPATASVNVTQTATVKSTKKTVTLYNAATGRSYGESINIAVTKPENTAISDIEIPALDTAGIEYGWWYDSLDPDTCNTVEIKFYLDSPQLTKSYKTNIIVHLKGAGSRKDKEVTYSIPVTITVKK